MQDLIIGYTLAIVSSIFHTIYIIPRKLSSQKPKYYTLYMSLGFCHIFCFNMLYIWNKRL